MALLADCQRYKPDEHARESLFNAELDINEQQSSSSVLRAIS
jgi:hypothetical protein